MGRPKLNVTEAQRRTRDGTFSIRLPITTIALIKKLAQETDRSQAWVIRDLIEKALK
jgi:predicted DNA-binding protein